MTFNTQNQTNRIDNLSIDWFSSKTDMQIQTLKEAVQLNVLKIVILNIQIRP